MKESKIYGKLKTLKHAVFRLLRSPVFWTIMLLPLSLLLILFADKVYGFAEGYYNTVYRVISLIINNIVSLLPFSLAEIIVLLLLPALIVYIVFLVVKVVKSKGKRLKTICKGVLRLIAFLCAAVFAFTLTCGINYYRADFSELSGIKTEKTSAEELQKVCIYLADKASELREDVSENEDGVFTVDRSAVFEKTKDAVNAVSEKYGFVKGGYGKAKGVMLSRAMSEVQIVGVFFPFTFEANVNMDSPDMDIPFSMCHELAHVRGIMHEEDANFVAFIACTDSKDKELEYSGYVMALMYAENALYSADKKLYSEYLSHRSSGIGRDIKQYSDYWKQFDTPVAETANKINDSYLKINSREEGVKSYGQVVDLIIAYVRAEASGE